MNKAANKIIIKISVGLIIAIVPLIVGIIIQDIRKKPTENAEKESNAPVHIENTAGDGATIVNTTGDGNTINVDQSTQSTQTITQIFYPENPVPHKIAPEEESLTIRIIGENAGSGSAFRGDVLIQLNTIQDRPGYAAIGTITIKPTWENEPYNYMGLASPPMVIGDYTIDVVEIARDHAKFRIIKGKT
jgi:hypothetical protein